MPIKGKGKYMDTLDKIVQWNMERGLDKQPSDLTAANKMLFEELMELNGCNNSSLMDKVINGLANYPITEEEKVDALCDLIVLSVGELLKLKYDPVTAMNETIKEISSRTGAFNGDTGKWEKFKTPEAQALWYTACYGKAKL